MPKVKHAKALEEAVKQRVTLQIEGKKPTYVS